MLTQKQNQRYWRTWATICRVQGWAKESSEQKTERRHALHRHFKLAPSHTDWRNADFSKWLAGTAHLCDQVDVRDRDRENVEWTITRLSEALQQVLGKDYATAILRDFGDTIDLDNLPLQSASHIDLENFRNTLKDRLGRIITRIKNGELEPGPDCPVFGDLPQARIIDALIHKRALHEAPARRKYVLDDSASFHGTPAPVPAAPAAERPRRPRPVAKKPTAPVSYGSATLQKYCMHPVPPPKAQPVAAITHEPDPF